MNVTQGLRRALQVNPHGIAIRYGEAIWTWAETDGCYPRG